MTDKKYKIGIIGGGAVGLSYAALLAHKAYVIVKTRRKEQAEEIKTKGISLTERSQHSKDEKQSLIHEVDTTCDMADLAECDAIIITVKTYDTEKVTKELSNVLKPNAEILTLQNGFQGFEVLKRSMNNPSRVFAGVSYIGAMRIDNRSISLGYNLRTIIDSNATILVKIFQSSRFELEASTNITQATWDKMVLTAGQNALGAITNLTLGGMGKSEECLKIAEKLLGEVKQVAKAEGITFNYSLMNKLKDNWKMSRHHPSMWQDLQLKKKTEIDTFNGAISQLGKKHGIATPYNDMITSLIKIIEVNQ